MERGSLRVSDPTDPTYRPQTFRAMKHFPIHHAIVLLALCATGLVRGAEEAGQPVSTLPNLRAPTFGGIRFWTDQWFFHDWRIQRHAVTGHCRLLDDAYQRRGWGTFEQCHSELDRIIDRKKLPPMRGKAVVVLHGLFCDRFAMNSLCQYLRDEGGYRLFNVGYASTRETITAHAQALDRVVSSLSNMEEINFVAHSMGNLVIRRWLFDVRTRSDDTAPDPRIKRIVMIGPPNHGAQLARIFLPIDPQGVVSGPSLRQLGEDWPELAEKLATPSSEFGILAGGLGDARGRSPLIKGDDDGIVSVQSTRLVGARDFRVLPVWHPVMMDEPDVQSFTLRFLQHGHFENEETRQPIGAKNGVEGS